MCVLYVCSVLEIVSMNKKDTVLHAETQVSRPGLGVSDCAERRATKLRTAKSEEEKQNNVGTVLRLFHSRGWDVRKDGKAIKITAGTRGEHLEKPGVITVNGCYGTTLLTFTIKDNVGHALVNLQSQIFERTSKEKEVLFMVAGMAIVNSYIVASSFYANADTNAVVEPLAIYPLKQMLYGLAVMKQHETNVKLSAEIVRMLKSIYPAGLVDQLAKKGMNVLEGEKPANVMSVAQKEATEHVKWPKKKADLIKMLEKETAARAETLTASSIKVQIAEIMMLNQIERKA